MTRPKRPRPKRPPPAPRKRPASVIPWRGKLSSPAVAQLREQERARELVALRGSLAPPDSACPVSVQEHRTDGHVRALRAIWPHVRPVSGLVAVAVDARCSHLWLDCVDDVWPKSDVCAFSLASGAEVPARPRLVLMRRDDAAQVRAMIGHQRLGSGALAVLAPLGLLATDAGRALLRDHPAALYPLPASWGLGPLAWYVWGPGHRPRTIHHLEER